MQEEEVYCNLQTGTISIEKRQALSLLWVVLRVRMDKKKELLVD